MESEDTADTESTDTMTEIDPQCEEFVCTIIDVVQDFLSARKVDLHNEEPTEDGWPDPTLIHGSDFDALHDDILLTLEQWGFVF